MKATVEREPFAAALAAVKRAVAAKAQIPILATVRLTGVAGALELRATNLDIAASATVPYDGKDFTLCAPGYMLEGLAGARAADIGLSATGLNLTGSAGPYVVRGAILPAGEFPENFGDDADMRWTMPAERLRWLLASTMGMSDAPGSNRFFLAGVHLTVDDGKLTAVATDAHVMAVARHAVETLDALPDNVIVPQSACAEIVRFCDRARAANKAADVEITLSEGAIGFSAGNTRLWSKLIDGDYPAWRKIIVDAGANRVGLDVDDLAAAIGRVGIAPKTENSKDHLDPAGTLGLTAADGACTIAVKTSLSEIDDEIAVDDAAAFPLRFYKTRQLKTVLDGMHAGGFEQLTLSVEDDEKSPTRFEHALGEDYFGVIWPTRPPVHWRIAEHADE